MQKHRCARDIKLLPCTVELLQANFNDQDGGVLFGRWDGNYPSGTTPPTSWSGSVAILEQFWQNKNVIKYAQCWVFSGLVTTCMYTLVKSSTSTILAEWGGKKSPVVMFELKHFLN